MGLLKYSVISLLTLLGTTPLASARSLRNTIIPRQASSGFQCTYPAGWESCNDKNNRRCWVKDPSGKTYDIDTPYETDTPTGIERVVNLEVEEADISPDGFKRTAQLINGTYPGPLIEACWGDTLVVNVKNKIKHNGTTIHWHGLRMLNENQMDGVNGVTQCPIADGDTFTYRFHLKQYGHTWYHSHYSAQYTDGVAAPLLIHGPNTAEWSEEWSPIIVADWYHQNAYEAMHQALTGPPTAAAIVVNGTGRNNKDNTGKYFEQTFKRDESYLIRVINGGTDFHFHFSIDDHELQVVSADLVPIKPFTTKTLAVGIGQRYGVIVKANATAAKNGKYWMRTEYDGSSCNPNHLNFPYTDLDKQRVGIISYEDAGQGDPTSERWGGYVGCADPVIDPHIKWSVPNPTAAQMAPHYAGLDLVQSHKTHGFSRWELAETPLWINFSDPSIVHTDDKTWNPPEYALESYNAKEAGGFVYMLINSGNGSRTNMFAGSHPIHLHGHDFAVIKNGTGIFDPTNPGWNMPSNPPRRDVAMLPNNGHIVLAFKTDNPGIWLVHCHIGWHAGSGLALQVVERQSEISKTIGSIENVTNNCKKWTDSVNGPKNWDYSWQDDSGI